MGAYLGIFKMQFKGELQYRAKALSGIATQFFWGLMYICLYTAFMKDGSVNGFTLTQMTSYVWLGQAFFALRYIGIGKNVGSEITSGNVCYKYVRPINIYNLWYAEYAGEKLAATLLRFAPIIILSALLPNGMNLSLPVSFIAFILFLVSLVIGLMMCVAISMFSVNLIFKTMMTKGATQIVLTICSVLGGMYVPLPLMPKVLQNVLSYMPFRFISDLPFRIYVGNIPTKEALIFIGISIAWLVVLILLGRLLINRSAKKTIIQGG